MKTADSLFAQGNSHRPAGPQARICRWLILALVGLASVANEAVDLPYHVLGTEPTTAAQRLGAITVQIGLFAMVVGISIILILIQRPSGAQSHKAKEMAESRRLFQAFLAARQGPTDTLAARFEHSHPGAAAILNMKTQRQ
jgi:hypothetical protein